MNCTQLIPACTPIHAAILRLLNIHTEQLFLNHQKKCYLMKAWQLRASMASLLALTTNDTPLLFDPELEGDYVCSLDLPELSKAQLRSYRQALISLNVSEFKLRYLVQNIHPLPLPTIRFSNELCQSQHRAMVVGRICWLRIRRVERQALFPGRWQERYMGGSFPLDRACQLEILPASQHWLVDQTHARLNLPINAEWTAVFEVIGSLMEMEVACIESIRSMLSEAGIMQPDGMQRVENFTLSASAEAEKAEREECPVCLNEFSEAHTDSCPEDGGEDAVKTICGHFIGRKCLQRWTDGFEMKDNTTCPMCRTALIIGQFPRRLQPLLQEYITCLRSDPALDEEIDGFLLTAEPPTLVQCYAPELGLMLNRAHNLAMEASRFNTRLKREIRELVRFADLASPESINKL